MNATVFDIETAPLPEVELAALVPPFDPAEVRTGNLKDPEKIAAKLAEAEANHRRDFFDKAALDPLTGRVLVIGLLVFEGRLKRGAGSAECGMGESTPYPDPLPGRGGEGIESGRCVIIGHDDEAKTLREFWNVCRGEMGRINRMVGFNTHLFDLPFLIRRSWKHRITVPFGIRRGRYWGEEMVDLREAWQLGDRQARGSLDSIARHLGVGAKNGEGKQFGALWQTDRAKAVEYLCNDLELTRKISDVLGCR